MKKNLCGKCKVCCTVLKIDKEFLRWRDTDKAEGETCDKLGKVGCKCYLTRPKPCREYNCLWLQVAKQKIYKLEWRPDKLGFIVHAHDKNQTKYFMIQELERGSLDFNDLSKDQGDFLKEIFSLSQKLQYMVLIKPFGHDKAYPLTYTPK